MTMIYKDVSFNMLAPDTDEVTSDPQDLNDVANNDVVAFVGRDYKSVVWQRSRFLIVY